MSDTQAFRDRVAAYFTARPGCWIDGVTLESIGGRYAWRTRVSDCRTELGMVIENRQRRQTDAEGRRWTLSEYRYVPAVEAEPVKGHNLNQEFSLRSEVAAVPSMTERRDR